MQQVLICVGLIGSGKTTLAKNLSGFAYVSFDEEWHEKLQSKGELPVNMVHAMANKINSSGENIVIDGWWTWYWNWWTIKSDLTLEYLRELTSASIRVIYLPLGDREASIRYLHKRATGIYKNSPLENEGGYIRSIPLRRRYLLERINQWDK